MSLNRHLQITNHGTLISVEPLTNYAENWFKEKVSQDGMKMGKAYMIESRYWQDIKHGFTEDAYFDGQS